MACLHLHVISQDFESPHLKHKKHWNSFTTPFFIDAHEAVREIEQKGRVDERGGEEEGELLLKRELRCHGCKSVQPNMPRLKQHIRECPSVRALLHS